MRIFHSMVCGILAACGLVACGDGGSSAGGTGGTGGTSSSDTSTSTGSSSTTTTSTGTTQDQELMDGCVAGCEKVDPLSQMLGCSPTPNCVGDCVDYGKSIGSCEDEYLALNKCAVQNVNAANCHCSSGSDKILTCDLCPVQRGALQQCVMGG